MLYHGRASDLPATTRMATLFPMTRGIVVGLGCVLCAGGALAAAITEKPGSDTWTVVSGELAPRQSEVLASRQHALRAIKLWDYDRRACVLEVDQSSLNRASRATAGAIRACEPRVSQSWQAADVGAGRYITAIEVCTAEGREAPAGIRGLRVWGSQTDGLKVSKPSADVKLELFGCKRWRGKVACPEGTLATGIRAYSGERTTGITGLELRCHELTREDDQS
jgi:hypothetical protein